MQADIIQALNQIEDPELGIGIVDLGLIRRADWGENGIAVDFTMTSRSCPQGDYMKARIAEVLSRRFQEAASISVRLVWDDPWTLEWISEAGRRQLGWTSNPQPARSGSGLGRLRRVLDYFTPRTH